MCRIGREELAVCSEREVLDILELAFANSCRADIQHMLEFHSFGLNEIGAGHR